MSTFSELEDFNSESRYGYDNTIFNNPNPETIQQMIKDSLLREKQQQKSTAAAASSHSPSHKKFKKQKNESDSDISKQEKRRKKELKKQQRRSDDASVDGSSSPKPTINSTISGAISGIPYLTITSQPLQLFYKDAPKNEQGTNYLTVEVELHGIPLLQQDGSERSTPISLELLVQKKRKDGSTYVDQTPDPDIQSYVTVDFIANRPSLPGNGIPRVNLQTGFGVARFKITSVSGKNPYCIKVCVNNLSDNRGNRIPVTPVITTPIIVKSKQTKNSKKSGMGTVAATSSNGQQKRKQMSSSGDESDSSDSSESEEEEDESSSHQYSLPKFVQKFIPSPPVDNIKNQSITYNTIALTHIKTMSAKICSCCGIDNTNKNVHSHLQSCGTGMIIKGLEDFLSTLNNNNNATPLLNLPHILPDLSNMSHLPDIGISHMMMSNGVPKHLQERLDMGSDIKFDADMQGGLQLASLGSSVNNIPSTILASEQIKSPSVLFNE